jgi:predicted dehydrogenase
MKKINVGVIGLGVGFHHLKYYLGNKKCNVVKVCDFDKKKIFNLKKKYKKISYCYNDKDLINDKNINLISIASYDNFHFEQIVNCLLNNKHIFVEKPLCLNQFEYKRIKDIIAKRPKLKLSSNFVLRNSPQFVKLKKLIKKNYFGKIFYINSEYNYGRIHKLSEWRGSIPYYSVMHGGGLHLIDLALFLTNKKAVTVVASGNKISTSNSNFKHDDCVSAIIKYEDNLLMSVTSNFGCVTPHHHTISVYGTKMSFIQKYNDASIFTSRDKNTNIETMSIKYKNEEKSKILDSFVNSILFKKKALVSKKQTLESMAISIAINKSLKSKKWEKIKY